MSAGSSPASPGGQGPVLAPGQALGIVGGGQLGRMLAMAAARLGLRTIVLEPGADCPAAQVANRHLVAPYEDEAALAELAAACAVVTYEFENVPATAASALEARGVLRPGSRALATSQDRLVEKRFAAELGLATAPFVAVDDRDDLEAGVTSLGTGTILKTRRFGYDGKGQVRLAANPDPDAIAAAWDGIDRVPAVLEGVVPFEREVSIIIARDRQGRTECYEPAHNRHGGGILRTSTVPAGVAPATARAAVAAAEAMTHALDYVGVMGLELFVLGDGSIVVNEFAPRVHNSGHWTEAACDVSQFEQHVRAVAGWPLARPRRHSDAVMENLIGPEVDGARDRLAEPGSVLHLYGKGETRPGRKMGHVTRLRPR